MLTKAKLHIASALLSAIAVACGSAGSDESTATTDQAFNLNPPPVEPAGCVDVASSWSQVDPPCTESDAAPTGKNVGTAGEVAACNAEWALWSQLQAAGCTTPRQIAYVDRRAGIIDSAGSWGSYYSWCPQGNYPGATNGDGASIPHGCVVTPPSLNLIQKDPELELVLWVPLSPSGIVPGGCKTTECSE